MDLALSSDQGHLVAFQCPTRFPLSLLEVQGCAQPCGDLLSRKQDPVAKREVVAHQGSPTHNGELILKGRSRSQQSQGCVPRPVQGQPWLCCDPTGLPTRRSSSEGCLRHELGEQVVFII